MQLNEKRGWEREATTLRPREHGEHSAKRCVSQPMFLKLNFGFFNVKKTLNVSYVEFCLSVKVFDSALF